MIFEGTYRRFTGLLGGKAALDARFTHQESLAMAQVEPENFEMTRAGRRFVLGISAAVTGIAPGQAIPTTAPQWTLWNPDSKISCWLEELLMVLVSGTPGLGGSLWVTDPFTAPATAAGQAAGFTAKSVSNGARASKLLVKSGVTITAPAAPTWFQLDESRDGVTAAAFSTGYANGFGRRDLKGALCIPPLSGIGLAVIAPAGTSPLYAPLVRWVEQETDME